MPLLTTQSTRSFGLNNYVLDNATGFYSIASGVVDASGSTTVTFSSIPSTYSHLQIRCFVKVSSSSNLTVQFNGSTTGYANTWTEGNGGGAPSGARETGSSYIPIYASTATNSSYAAFTVIDIPDYKSGKIKNMRAMAGFDLNSTNPYGYVDLDGGVWNNTAAISSITIGLTGTSSMVQNSQIALYGIR